MNDISAFGISETTATKPLRDVNEPEVEMALHNVILEPGQARFGARKIEEAKVGEHFVFSDGTKTCEIWRAIIQVDTLPFDIAFGPKTTKSGATEEAMLFAKKLGGRPLFHVKEVVE